MPFRKLGRKFHFSFGFARVSEVRHIYFFSVQRDVSIPFSVDTDLGFSQCEQYKLNYSRYSTEDFITWNRSAMINSSTPVVKCLNGWVYDRHEFTETVLSRVSHPCAPCRNHQAIPTNATVSKDSDTISISIIMAVYEIFFIFQVISENQEIVYQHNITEN